MKPNAIVKHTEFFRWLYSDRIEFEDLGEMVMDAIIKNGRITLRANMFTKDIGYLPISLVQNKFDFKNRRDEDELSPSEWNKIILTQE